MPDSFKTADIDFLPIHYRQQETQRRNQAWRMLVVIIFCCLLLAITMYQHVVHERAASELARVDLLHNEATTQSKLLEELNAKIKPADAEAQLLTYLRHPWPRTQILAAIVQPLSEHVRLTRLHLTREANRQAPATPQPPAPTEADKAKKLALDPSESDLIKLRGELDPTQIEILLEGTTRDSATLHSYLGRLAEDSLFSKVELGLIQTVPGDDAPLHFTARVVVRPGYGQPDGPKPAQAAIAGNAASTAR